MHATTDTTRSTTSQAGRGRLAVAALVLVAASLLGGVVAPQANATTSAKPAYSLQAAGKNALNRDRTARGLAALRTQGDAQAKAQAWAENMASQGRIFHSRITDGIRTRWCALGENVGYGTTVQGVENAYMQSTKHRNNILSTKWNGVGVGVAVRGNTVYTVQVFIKTC